MPGHALGHAIVAAAGLASPRALVAGLPLLVFCGLLRPLETRARALAESRRTARGQDAEGVTQARRRSVHPEPPPNAVADPAGASTIGLNSIELALLAELSLEMAHAQDAVANDATQPPEVRRIASRVASAWRERARRFQLQAQRQGTDPIVPDGRSIHAPAPSYSGPERRKQTRRTQTRRTGPAASDGIDCLDRRVGPDRRERDRRGRQLAPR
jgi:hypothetical protein